MNINHILIIICFVALAIFGPIVGTQITEKRMIKERQQMIEALMEAQDIERKRLKTINEAHVEAIKNYRKKGERTMDRSHDDIINDFMLRENTALKKEEKIKKADPTNPTGAPSDVKQVQVKISEFLNQVNISFSTKINSFAIPPQAAIQMAKNIETVARKIMTVPPVGVTKQ